LKSIEVLFLIFLITLSTILITSKFSLIILLFNLALTKLCFVIYNISDSTFINFVFFAANLLNKLYTANFSFVFFKSSVSDLLLLTLNLYFDLLIAIKIRLDNLVIAS